MNAYQVMWIVYHVQSWEEELLDNNFKHWENNQQTGILQEGNHNFFLKQFIAILSL